MQTIADRLHAGIAVIFDCFGDSTCFGADPSNLPNPVGRPAPDQLQIFLRGYFGNNSATVINRGINSTNIAQMLDGTDGSGQTFDERIRTTAATVIYCNHCMNTATNIAVTADAYRADLMMVVAICRKYGKTLVLETPNPAGGYGITTPYWAERVRTLAEVMRSMAKATDTPLVDNFYWCEKVISTGKYTMLQLLGDGIHPTQMLYLMKGQNMAIPLITGGAVKFTAENQYLPCTDAQVMASPGSVNNIVNGKFGKVLSTPTGSESIRVAYVVEEPGLDIYMGHLTWSSGSTAISIKDDENILISSSYSMLATLGTGTTFITDQEVCVIENATPGLRMLDLSCLAGAIGLNFLRTRKTGVAKNIVVGGPSSNYRKTLLENFEFTVSTESTMILDDFPVSTLLNQQEYELSATLGKSTGLVLHGFHLTDQASVSQALPGLVVGLDASGFLCIWEHDLTSMVKTIIMSGADYSLVARRWYISVDATTVHVVDYASGAATPYLKLRAYYGGLLGFWKLASGTLVIDKLVKVVRFS